MPQNLSLDYKNVNLELKVAGDSGEFSGYVALYNIVDQGGDIIEPGAFENSLVAFKSGARTPRLLWQHSSDKPIGIWNSFEDTSQGLKGSGRLLKEVRLGAEAHALLSAGAIDGLSIGYHTIDSESEETPKGRVRRLKEVELWEVSVVTFPMQADALVTDVKQLEHIGEVERILRDAGVPNTFAKMVAAYGYPEAINRLNGDQRDVDDAETSAQIKSLLKQLNGLKEKLNAG